MFHVKRPGTRLAAPNRQRSDMLCTGMPVLPLPHRSDDALARRLARLDELTLLRPRHPDGRDRAQTAACLHGRPLLDLSSNDYLGLARLPLVPTDPDSAPSAGAGASRLIHGTAPQHNALERALSDWLATEDALLFSSGYAANVGLVSALAGPDDVILSDALNHASLIDGARLARAEIRILPHRDVNALREQLEALPRRTIWFVTEAYFSMDGTQPDLPAVNDCLSRHGDAHLVLDEAHSLGVFGPEGRGLGYGLEPRPAATVGTFGKAFGLQGAFIAGSRTLCQWLWNRARSFVYSTASSPALAAVLLQRLERVRAADPERAKLSALSQSFHDALLNQLGSHHLTGNLGPIVPYALGTERAALHLAESLLSEGILTQAIRPPTVPHGSARLRMTLHAALSEADLDRVVRALKDAPPP